MIRESIIKLSKKQNLTYQEAEEVMDEIMSGKATPVQMSAYLTALALKGETIDEITASAAGMRAHCIKLLHDMESPGQLLDVISPVGKTARTGHFLAVNHLRGAYIGNLRQTCQNALTIDIAKASLNIILLIKRQIQAGMLLANLRQVLYFRCYFHLKSCHSNKLLSF